MYYYNIILTGNTKISSPTGTAVAPSNHLQLVSLSTLVMITRASTASNMVLNAQKNWIGDNSTTNNADTQSTHDTHL